jgi:hypothetical protein
VRYQSDKVMAYEDNGELFIYDLDAELEPKKVWSRQSCHKRILKLLEELPAAKREQERVIKAWWQLIVLWQEKQSSKGCELLGYWSNYCVHQMIEAWEEIHGEPKL